MAGKMRIACVATLALAGTLVSALAQTATPVPGASPKEGKHQPWFPGRPAEGAPSGPAFENVRKALEALTPEQRKRFADNLVRWANLSPEEKKALRDKEEVRKKLVEQETDAAIKESGLQLEGDRREQFAKRYSEGRRLIEEQLRKEMAEKRKPLVRDLVNRLRTEFANEGTPTVSSPGSEVVSPVAPATPAKN
jgi:hypothetical protein